MVIEQAKEQEIFFQPVSDGVEMLLKISTKEDIQGAFCVQQCLRYSGCTCEKWRKNIAQFPVLSEYDRQAQGRPNESITYARRRGEWFHFPVPMAKIPAPAGVRLTQFRTQRPLDNGLILREERNRCRISEILNDIRIREKKVCYASGMYWERTAYVSNRHPADCLHSGVDFGPLKAGQSRTVRGKFYFLIGTKDDILARWKKDFPPV